MSHVSGPVTGASGRRACDRRQPCHPASPGPHNGDDTYDLIDDALTRLAERRGAWLGDDSAVITLPASLIDQAERCFPELVTNARLNGHTWDEIARALTTSPNEARLRFDLNPPSPTPDGPTTFSPQQSATLNPRGQPEPRTHKRDVHKTRDASPRRAAADQPQATPAPRQALAVIDDHVDEYIAQARLKPAA